MGLELVIAGRRALPAHDGSWTLQLERWYSDTDDDDDDDDAGDEGSLIAWEPERDDPAFFANVAKVVGFTPASVVVIRPAGWDMSVVVAEELAYALEGVVYCYGYDSPEPHFIRNATGVARPVGSMNDLEQRIRDSFDHPKPIFARWAREERAQFQAQLAKDPTLAKENDWSGL